VRRGEICTVAGGKGYAGKARPVVIVQDDRFETTKSVTICGFTTNPVDAPLFRLPIEPDDENSLHVPCRIMVDKVVTVPRTKLGKLIGRLSDEDVFRLNRALLVFLGIAGRGTRD
jgi:mRNA interferase MazF